MTIAINIAIKDPKQVFNDDFYSRLFDYDNFTEVYYGGASSGKSHGVIQKVIIKCCQSWEIPRKVLWLRKVGAAVKLSIFQDVKDGLADLGLLPFCKVNNSSYEIVLPNGALFIFKGLDDSEKIKSIKGISDVVMEEATDFILDDYTQLVLRLREKKQKKRQIFLMFNPVSKLNWVYKEFFEGAAPAGTKVIQSTFLNNRFLDDAVKQHIMDLERTNPAYYRIYALGEFATLDKLVFPTFEKRRLDPHSDELKELPDYFGLDFGYTNDPTFFVRVKVDMKKKKLYFIEEMCRKGMLNDSIAHAIKSMGYSKEVITADAAEQKSIAEIKRDGIRRIKAAKKGPDSIIQGISFMQQFEIIVDDRCVKIIEELENYTYIKDKQTGEYTNTPVDSYNHGIDATRYALEPLNGSANPRANTFKNYYF
ncbi:phage terminase, large subunit, PBSX family [Lactobacillus selangorensis]|uniref:Phage terminase, large subunit, PBSX family n=1 Tax=Lactobacillus selangorensis TaxID=81857 RepID=A0A0R2FKX1_9LACO|nr:PBSX family phage terminase large subunit [Lactobacillus selangorensis]KRN29224.1 phage terminase, large subunit, PBSX family [Lactobacillus selangorensis]KRN31418.1 phage terminase, large subunit, PBSX family [Lactobacillus selangorensis]